MSSTFEIPSCCTLCPRSCGADRAAGQAGYCGAAGTLKDFSFMDLDEDLVNRQLERERTTRKSGPLPEAVVRDAAMRQ